MTPDQTLKHTEHYLGQLQKAVKTSVKVGLPSDKVGGEIYQDGQSIIDVGAQHEYGTNKVPMRSFLRMPFEVKKDEMGSFIQSQFRRVLEKKKPAKDAMELIGIQATNISKEAFRSNGFGNWAPLAERTKKAKAEAGKTTTLIWSGILRNAITWVVK